MKRFEDLSDDYYLQTGLESLQELVDRIKMMQDKNKILQAALSEIGAADVDAVEASSESYAYIPIDLDDFFDKLIELEKHLSNDPDYRHSEARYRPCSFVEVGCGVGRNIFLLNATSRFRFDKIVGFDIVEAYVDAARKYFDLGDKVFVQDCMTFDYGGYDVIYFYRPFVDDEKQEQFETYLMDSCKLGAYVIGCNATTLDESPRMLRKDDGLSIWKRI